MRTYLGLGDRSAPGLTATPLTTNPPEMGVGPRFRRSEGQQRSAEVQFDANPDPRASGDPRDASTVTRIPTTRHKMRAIGRAMNTPEPETRPADRYELTITASGTVSQGTAPDEGEQS